MTPPQLTIDGPIATLRLCRPAQANRLELDDLEAIRAHIDALNATPSVRVVLVRGEGQHFCSGFHIDTVPQVDAPALFEALCNAWESVEPITVAVLHGGVWGGATDLALACDFRLGCRDTQMAIPAARLGLHYHAGGMRRLVSRLGLGPAKRLLLAAQSLDAEAMAAAHFLDVMYDDRAQLEAGTLRWAEQLAGLAPLALRGMKRQLNALGQGTWRADRHAQDAAECARSRDLAEGVAAWQARRPPEFKGE